MEDDFLLAEQELRLCGDKAIGLVKVASKEEGKSVVAKRRAGGIYVVDHLRGISLLDCFASKFKSIYPPIRSCQKSRGKGLDDLASLIESQGGLKKAIVNLRSFLHEYGNKARKLNDEELFYGSRVLGVCLDAEGATTRKGVRRYRMPLPFCALCWRRVEDSKYYCQIHHPKQSSNKYYSSRTALIHAVKKSKLQYQRELGERVEGRSNIHWGKLMYKWTGSFAPPITGIKVLFPSIDDPKNSWEDIASMILDYCKDSLPKTRKKLGGLTATDYQSWRDFSLGVIAKLDPIESAFWEADSIDDWLDLGQPIPAWLTLLSLLGRYEAYEIICSMPNHRGPKKGEVPVNESLRDDIRAEVKRIQSEGGKVVQAQIARKFGVSRNTINKHMKKLVVATLGAG
tara:strand:+ start:462 stop:1658 length:1197 start_codon:yes stop_codon:yes gene_type:complete